MNQLKVKIIKIESSENMSIVIGDHKGIELCAILIETPVTADYLKEGEEIKMAFKETEISIGKDLSGELSLRNRIPAVIKSIQKGRIMCQLKLNVKGEEIVSVISTGSVNRMKLAEEDFVEAIVKSNEMFIIR